MSSPGPGLDQFAVVKATVVESHSDDARLDELIVALGMAKLHFYRAMQIANNLRHRENGACISERLMAIHDELNHISGFAESRKS